MRFLLCLMMVSGCKRNLSFRDTEGRRFSGICDAERWSDCVFNNDTKLTYGHLFMTVCPVNQSHSSQCRPVACDRDDDCPSFKMKKTASCRGGLCRNILPERVPPLFLEDGDVKMLCLAGTGVPASPPTALQEERWAKANGACEKRRCFVPAECRPPTGLDPAPRAALPASSPAPRVLAVMENQPAHLKLDGDSLLVSVPWQGITKSKVRVLRVPIVGGEPKLVIGGEKDPLEEDCNGTLGSSCLVAGSGADVYQATSRVGLATKPLAGTIARVGQPPLASESASGLAADGERVYWTISGTFEIISLPGEWTPGETRPNPDGKVRACAKTGGAPITLADKERAPRSLHADAQNLYWRSSLGIRRMKKEGGAPVSMVSEAIPGRELMGDEKSLYWVTDQGELVSVPK